MTASATVSATISSGPPPREERERPLGGRKILLGVTGGIACYKAVWLLRDLVRGGAEVRVVMTHAAQEFIGRLTFATLSGNPVATEGGKR